MWYKRIISFIVSVFSLLNNIKYIIYGNKRFITIRGTFVLNKDRTSDDLSLSDHVLSESHLLPHVLTYRSDFYFGRHVNLYPYHTWPPKVVSSSHFTSDFVCEKWWLLQVIHGGKNRYGKKFILPISINTTKTTT